MTINVKLTQVPGATNEYVLNDGATLGDLLTLAGRDGSNYSIRHNGATAGVSSATRLSCGDVVMLSKNAVGNGFHQPR